LKRLTTQIAKDLSDIFQVNPPESPMILRKKRDKVFISLSSWGHRGRVWSSYLFHYLELKYGLWIDQIEPLEETVVGATFKYLPTSTGTNVNPDYIDAKRQLAKNRVKTMAKEVNI